MSRQKRAGKEANPKATKATRMPTMPSVGVNLHEWATLGCFALLILLAVFGMVSSADINARFDTLEDNDEKTATELTKLHEPVTAPRPVPSERIPLLTSTTNKIKTSSNELSESIARLNNEIDDLNKELGSRVKEMKEVLRKMEQLQAAPATDSPNATSDPIRPSPEK